MYYYIQVCLVQDQRTKQFQQLDDKPLKKIIIITIITNTIIVCSMITVCHIVPIQLYINIINVANSVRFTCRNHTRNPNGVVYAPITRLSFRPKIAKRKNINREYTIIIILYSFCCMNLEIITLHRYRVRQPYNSHSVMFHKNKNKYIIIL